MELNVKIKVESPDILKGLLALAEEISKASFITKEMGQVVVKEETVKCLPKEITLEEVRGFLTRISQDGKQKEVKALITGFGVSKLTDIPKDKYSELLKEAEKL